MQAMAHSMQWLRRPKVTLISAFKKALQEWQIVALMAATAGIIVGLVSLFWREGVVASSTIGIGIMVSVFVSASFGISLPIILHTVKLDPKVASGPIVLMFADVLTTAFYLSLASVWLL